MLLGIFHTSDYFVTFPNNFETSICFFQKYTMLYKVCKKEEVEGNKFLLTWRTVLEKLKCTESKKVKDKCAQCKHRSQKGSIDIQKFCF